MSFFYDIGKLSAPGPTPGVRDFTIRTKKVSSNLKDYMLLIFLLGLFVYLTRSGVLSSSAVQWLTDLSWTIFSGLAALACYVHAQKHAGNLRKAWLLLAYAHLSWFIGIIIWSYLELVAMRATPFPAWSDVGFMLFAPLFLLAMYFLRSADSQKYKFIHQAKVMIIIVIIAIAHIILFNERLLNNNESIWYNIAAITYPALYMTALIYGLLSFLHLNATVSTKVFSLIFLSLLVHAVTVSLYAYSLLGKEYQVGSYLDVFWLLAFGLIYLAVKQTRVDSTLGNTFQRLMYIKFVDTRVVPILLAILAITLLINVDSLNEMNSEIYIYALSALLLAIIIYQLAVSRLENILIKNLASSEVLLEKSNEDIIRLARETAESLGREIQKNRLKDIEIKKHHLLINTIKMVQDEYISGIGRHEFFERLLNTILDLTNSEYGFIGEVLYKDNQPYLKTYAISNIAWDEETRKFYDEHVTQGLEFYNHDNLFGHTLKTNEIVISNDPKNDPRSGGLPNGHPDLNAYLGVPLMANNNLMGMLGVANRDGGYHESEVECWQPFFQTCGSLVLANKVDLDRKKAEESLIAAKSDAEIANNAKSEFISRMSHELRTPLNAVIGFAQLLEMDDTLNLDQKDSIREIHVAGKHLLELISDLLDVSRIETGKFKYNFESTPVVNIIEASVNFIDKLAREKNISINYPKKNTCKVNGDVVRLKQVFTNLLSNAVKYNQDGGKVDISIDIDNENYCVIDVSDTGIGIPEDRMDKLFTPFERLGAETKSIDGVGIGLYITKQIVESHGGSITVSKNKEQGSTFSVRIPSS